MILKNKVAIVTGGSRGIGRAVADEFAREGAQVAIAARTAHELKAAAKEMGRLCGPVYAVRADISKKKDVRAFVEKTVKKYGRIDILVNNAGVIGPIGPLSDIEIDEWVEAIHINLIGAFLCMKSVLPHMIKQRSGKIINLSGGGAVSPRPNFSAYSASKAAVVRLTETLAGELRRYNIQVNAIAPGMVKTKITRDVVAAARRAGEKEFREASTCVRGGGTSPEKAARLAVFLASSASAGLTGKLISAQWDDWEFFGKNARGINASSLYTMRRIDNRYFKEAKRCSR